MAECPRPEPSSVVSEVFRPVLAWVRPMRALVAVPVSVLVALALAGCSSTAGVPSATQRSQEADRVMVTLPTTTKYLVRRSIEELIAAYDLRFVAAWEMRSLDVQCVVFEIPPTADRGRMVRILEGDHRVDMAQAVGRFSVEGIGGAEERSYRRLQRAADVLHLDEAHRLATGVGVRVAVIDTGADLGHQEFGKRIAVARNFVNDRRGSFTEDAHGTAVAGLIAADHRDGVGIVGVAPDVELMLLKACWPESNGSRRAACDSYTLALAIDFAVTEGAQVINLSLGGPEEPILRRLLEEADRRGIVVVAAWPSQEPRFPASLSSVLGVRALGGPSGSPLVEEPKVLARDEPLAAPGEEVLTTTPGGGYDFWSGSSMAAAQVAGVAALLLEHQPEQRPSEVVDILRATARDNPGRLVVDACGAVAQVTGESCR